MRAKQLKFTVADIANYQKVDRKVIYRDIKKGKFDPYYLPSLARYLLYTKKRKKVKNTMSMIFNDQSYSKTNTYNPDTPDHKTDGQSVFTLNGNDCVATFNNCTFDGSDVHWGFKATASLAPDGTTPIVINGAYYNNCTFIDGLERAYDQVRGGNVVFTDCKFINTGKYRKIVKNALEVSSFCDCGLKAGVFNVEFIRCSINDVLLGDYSIYDQIKRPKTRGISFDSCVNPNGGPIFVRGWYADANTIWSKNTLLDVNIHPAWMTTAYFDFEMKYGDNRKDLPGEFVITPVELTPVTNPFAQQSGSLTTHVVNQS